MSRYSRMISNAVYASPSSSDCVTSLNMSCVTRSFSWIESFFHSAKISLASASHMDTVDQSTAHLLSACGHVFLCPVGSWQRLQLMEPPFDLEASVRDNLGHGTYDE